MTEFKVTVLGSGSAIPTSWHNPSSQVVEYDGRQFLIDCGEGTQMQMIKFKIRHRRLDHIFISHLHGDHFYGLIGLINSFHLMKREKALHIFASEKLKPLIEFHLTVTNTKLNFPLEFHFLEQVGNGTIYQNKYLTISCFPLLHSLPVWGFLVKEKKGRRRISKSFIDEYNPTIEQLKQIADGADFSAPDGRIIQHNSITLPPHKQRSFAYCSDTAYLESTAKYVEGVDLLYHESTFDNSNQELAQQTKHSTAADAAKVAKEAHAKKLLIGHYSARYKELDALLEEAREVFPESYLSREGETYLLT